MKLHKFEDIRRSKNDPARDARIRRRVDETLTEISLTELRTGLGLTQVELAAAAEMTQSDISKLEKRSDHRISTLRRCVEALGGELEVTAVVKGKRVKLNV